MSEWVYQLFCCLCYRATYTLSSWFELFFFIAFFFLYFWSKNCFAERKKKNGQTIQRPKLEQNNIPFLTNRKFFFFCYFVSVSYGKCSAATVLILVIFHYMPRIVLRLFSAIFFFFCSSSRSSSTSFFSIYFSFPFVSFVRCLSQLIIIRCCNKCWCPFYLWDFCKMHPHTLSVCVL